jgi:hypothetical protein
MAGKAFPMALGEVFVDIGFYIQVFIILESYHLVEPVRCKLRLRLPIDNTRLG